MKNSAVKSKEEYWKEHLRKFNGSGMSRRKYCAEENLSYWTFRDWQKKIEADYSSEKLVKISHRDYPAVKESQFLPQSTIEIIVSQKISIRLNKNFDGELLRSVMSELGVEL